VIYALSADLIFQEIGKNTRINYKTRFRQYKQYITEGLTAKDSDFIDLMKMWNDRFFTFVSGNDGDSGDADIDEFEVAQAERRAETRRRAAEEPFGHDAEDE
jgi:hypothetical protein